MRKNLCIILGLLWLFAPVVALWVHDWRWGVGMLALSVSYVAVSIPLLLADRRVTERAIAISAEWEDQAIDCLKGWKKSAQLHKARRFDAIYWFIAFGVMSALALWFAHKLDRVAKNG